MAINYWLGVANAVSQVATVQVTSYDAATTYQLKIGSASGDVIASAVAAGGVDQTATALAAAITASNDPRVSGQFTASASTDTVTLTSAVAGVPFVVVSAVSGGSGTIGSVTESTANSGPNVWSVAANWSLGTAPSGSDDVVLIGSVSCLYLPTAEQQVNSFSVDQAYSGKLGLVPRQFTLASGSLTSAKPEYRQTHLKLNTASSVIDATSSQRISVDAGTSSTSQTQVINTRAQSDDSNQPVVRLLSGNTGSSYVIRSGNVGIAADAGQVATASSVILSSGSGSPNVTIGAGCVVVTVEVQSGNAMLWESPSGKLSTIQGSTVQVEGTSSPQTVEAFGGSIFFNAAGTITQLSMDSGTIDFTRGLQVVTVSNLTVYGDGSVVFDPAKVTLPAPTYSANQNVRVNYQAQ